MIALLKVCDRAMLVHYSPDSFDAVVEDVLLGIPSSTFVRPQMGLIKFRQASLGFLDL